MTHTRPGDAPGASGESYSLARAKADQRDDGGSTPYRDVTGEQAVWNLLRDCINIPGTYTISGPHGLTAEISAELLNVIQFRREPSRRNKERLVAFPRKKDAPAVSDHRQGQ